MLTSSDKIRVLRELTRGAPDCFAVHVLHSREGSAGWRPVYAPLADTTVRLHLAGHLEIGSYPMVPSPQWDRCFWIAADFDGKKEHANWRGDVQRAVAFLLETGCALFVNLSRSAQGAHVRVLFRDSVPAWLARRWLTSWLQEAGVMPANAWENEIAPSFDRLFPTQDHLSGAIDQMGNRMPGNLTGSPLHARHARHGGTLPLDPKRVAKGDFEPKGDHWTHALDALELRQWGETELLAATADCLTPVSTKPPAMAPTPTPIDPGSIPSLQHALAFCEFFREMRRPGTQTYPLWIALATQLHRFGDAGRETFHRISALDSRYNARDCDAKWVQTASLSPVRCESLIQSGWRCPHLSSPRCNGAKAPSYFTDHADAEVL